MANINLLMNFIIITVSYNKQKWSVQFVKNQVSKKMVKLGLKNIRYFQRKRLNNKIIYKLSKWKITLFPFN